jgi:hypothetical protein
MFGAVLGTVRRSSRGSATDVDRHFFRSRHLRVIPGFHLHIEGFTMPFPIGQRPVQSHRPPFVADARRQLLEAEPHRIDARRSQQAAAVLAHDAPLPLGDKLGMPVGYRGDPRPYQRGTPLGDVSACTDAVGLAKAIIRHEVRALALLKEHATELLARIASNDELDPETKLLHINALVRTVSHSGGKIDFVTQGGQFDLRRIVDAFRHTPGVRQDQIARLLIELESVPKKVQLRDAQLLLQQAQPPGWVAPDFNVFKRLHAENHLPGERGGRINGHTWQYEYPHGRKFSIHRLEEKSVPAMNGYYALRLASPLLALAAQRSG